MSSRLSAVLCIWVIAAACASPSYSPPRESASPSVAAMVALSPQPASLQEAGGDTVPSNPVQGHPPLNEASRREYERWAKHRKDVEWAVRFRPAVAHFSTQIGGLWSAGGNFGRVVESYSSLFGFRLLFNIRLDRRSALSPYLMTTTYTPQVKHSEMFWSVGVFGLGLRYNPSFETEGIVYVEGDASYLVGNGQEDARIRHPGFDTTLFEGDASGQMQPRDIYGYSIGATMGYENYGTRPYGPGLAAGARYQDGTRGITAIWIHASATFTYRF